MLAAMGSLAAALWAVVHPRTLLLGTVAFLLAADFLKRRRPKNYPPGPWRLPFLGNFFLVDFEQSHLEVQLVGAGEGAWRVLTLTLFCSTRDVPATWVGWGMKGRKRCG